MAKTLLDQHMPDLANKLQTLKPDLANLKYVYANVLSKSIDYGVMEKVRDKLILHSVRLRVE